jgi:hypothetical protein
MSNKQSMESMRNVTTVVNRNDVIFRGAEPVVVVVDLEVGGDGAAQHWRR